LRDFLLPAALLVVLIAWTIAFVRQRLTDR
jgi:hypothetical protein